MQISEVYYYPVKSMAGISLPEMALDAGGPAGDRAYAVVKTSTGQVVTARERPLLLTILPEMSADGQLKALTAAGQRHSLNPNEASRAFTPCSVWGDTVQAQDMGDSVAAFLSDQLAQSVRLVSSLDPAAKRQSDLTVAPNSFADAMPLLITTVPSLRQLNQTLDQPVPMSRFRPNIIVDGDFGSYAEDQWSQLSINTVDIEIGFGCTRCVMVNMDGAGQKDSRLPVTAALKASRQGSDKQLYFGQNATPKNRGIIRVGDTVVIMEKRPSQRLNQAGKEYYSD